MTSDDFHPKQSLFYFIWAIYVQSMKILGITYLKILCKQIKHLKHTRTYKQHILALNATQGTDNSFL